MKPVKNYEPLSCAHCMNGEGLDFGFTMAFQPIMNIATGNVFAQEALVRGLKGESAGSILGRVNDENRYRFDQSCRATAIRLASRLGVNSFLSINFLPNAIYQPENCIRATLEAAQLYHFPPSRIIFEITESEEVDAAYLREIVDYYREQGFWTAIDDFGAGYAGLGLLSEFKTDLVKLDMKLLRNIDTDRNRQAIVKGIIQVCRDLSIEPIAEGIETYEELAVVRGLGVELVQGYYFAKPAFESLAEVPAELLTRR